MQNKTGNIGSYVYDDLHHNAAGSSSFITNIEGRADQHYLYRSTFYLFLQNFDCSKNNCKIRIGIQYLPFGELFVNQSNNHDFDSRYKFTAKELDNETNYTYFGARYYDSDLSSWLSVDPMSDSRPNLSPYNYCSLNPVARVDPTGALDTDEANLDWFVNKKTGAVIHNKNENRGYERELGEDWSFLAEESIIKPDVDAYSGQEPTEVYYSPKAAEKLMKENGRELAPTKVLTEKFTVQHPSPITPSGPVSSETTVKTDIWLEVTYISGQDSQDLQKYTELDCTNAPFSYTLVYISEYGYQKHSWRDGANFFNVLSKQGSSQSYKLTDDPVYKRPSDYPKDGNLRKYIK